MSKIYGRRWDNSRKTFLRNNPLCRYCQRIGQLTAATVVDHIVPHRGDMALFWDQDNWQPLCKRCHDSVKQAEERAGMALGCDADGTPLAGWYRRATK